MREKGEHVITAAKIVTGANALGEAGSLSLCAFKASLSAAATDSSRLLLRSVEFGRVTSFPGALDLLEAAGFAAVSQAWSDLGDVLAMPDYRMPRLLSVIEALQQAEAAQRTDPPAASALVSAPSSTALPNPFPPMDEALVAAVLALGFPEVRVRKAVLAGMRGSEQAVDWLLQHGEDAGIDDPIPLAEIKKAEGNKAHAKKDLAAAIQLYSEAIELDPSNHVYYSNRSACLAEVGRFAEAKADGKRCVSIDPTFAKGKPTLGPLSERLNPPACRATPKGRA